MVGNRESVTDSASLQPVSSALHQVRPVALVVLVIGVGLALSVGAWAVAVGLALSGVLCFGLIFRSLDRRLKSHIERGSLGTGTAITMSTLSVLPTLVVGIVCLAFTSKYWWVGLPAGWFLGFAVSLVALYGAIIVGLRRVHGQPHSPA